MNTMKKTMMLTVAVAGLAFASDGARGDPGRGGRQGGHPEDARVRPAVLHASSRRRRCRAPGRR